MAKEKDIAWPVYKLLDILSLSERNLGLNETLSRDSRDAAGGGGVGLSNEGQISLQLAVDVNNSLVLTILIVVLIIYLILAAVLLIKRWWGGRTPLYVLKWPPKSIKTANPYIVTIVTGTSSDSGTEGTLIFSVDGSQGSSESYAVKGGGVHFERKLLTRCAQDCFLIINEEPIGTIQQAKVALWATEPRDNWYLSYITVLDVKRNVSVYLPFRDWIKADPEGGKQMTVDASKASTTSVVFVDNLLVGFVERYIWISAWLSTVLGSKVDSIFSFTLCYLCFVVLMFISVVFFYSGAYGFNDYITGLAFVYLFFLTVLITAIIGIMQTAMRMIRVGGRDFVSRYSPILLRDLTTPQVRWDGDSTASSAGGTPRPSAAQKGTNEEDGGPAELPEPSRSSVPGGGGGGGATGGDAMGGGATGGDAMGGGATGGDAMGSGAMGGGARGSDATGGGARGSDATGGGARGSDATGGGARGSDATGGGARGSGATGGGARGSDATGGGARGSVATSGDAKGQRTPSSLGMAEQKNNSAIAQMERSRVIGAKRMARRRGRGAYYVDDDDDYGGGDEQMNNNNNRTKSPSNVFPGITPFVKDSQRSTEVKDKFSSFEFLGGRTGHGPSRTAARTKSSGVFGGGGGEKVARRRFETHLDPPGRPYSRPRNSHQRLGSAVELDRSRNVAFKSSSKSNHNAQKYSAKPTTSDFSHSILKKPDDWKIKPFPFTPQDSRLYAYHGQQSPEMGHHHHHHHHHHQGGWYDIGVDPLRRRGDPTPKEDRAMRTHSESATRKTSHHSKPTDDSSGRFHSFKASNRSGSNRGPVRQRKIPAPMTSDSFLACDRSAKSCFELFVGGGGRRAGRRRSDEVERNWNALWNNVRPRDGDAATNDDPVNDGSNASPEGKARRASSAAAAADLRRFAGKLVENIVRKIKRQLANPADQNVDLTSCEVDIKEFVRKMGMREVSGVAEATEDRCPSPLQEEGDGDEDPGASRADALEDSVAKVVASGARKNSLSMVEERVATIAGDVEKVMDQILGKMRQELGLDAGGGKTVSSLSPSLSSEDASRSMPSRTDEDAVQSLPKDEFMAEKLTDAKLARVAQTSVGSVLSVENLEAIRKKAEEAVDDNLKDFASNVVQSLYIAVRTKLEQLLKNEYDDLTGDETTTPFPSDELLRKADHEVREQVLPTVVEHIVWLMKEEADAVEQLDCDMMMIAFAGQYVDTIVTNAVLKTNVDLTKKRAYTRTFVVTSNSNKTNNNNSSNNNNNDRNNNSNRLDSMVERCLSEEILSISTLASLRATSVEVDDLLGRHGDAGDDVTDPSHQEILFRVLDELMERIRARTGGGGIVALAVETEREDEDEVCPVCRSETVRSAAARCLTPLLAKLIVDLVLDEAIGNAGRCVDQVRRNTARCSPEAMLALGRRLVDRSRQADDPLGVIDSVATELRTMAVDSAVEKVAGEMMAIGDSSRAEAERELRRKTDRFLADVQKNTEKMAMKAAIRANLLENTQTDGNVNYNAATGDPPGDNKPRSSTAAGAPPGDGLNDKPRFATADDMSADIDKPDEQSSEANPNSLNNTDNMMDDMIGVRNSLTRIADEDHCLAGRCRLHRGRLSRGLRSGRCEGLHLDESNSNNGEDPIGPDGQTLGQSLDELEGNTLSDLWNDPRDTRRTTFLVLGHLMLGITFFLVMTFNVLCIIFGLKLNSVQASLWLGMTFVALIVHLLLFEPIKVLVLAAYWALSCHDLMR